MNDPIRILQLSDTHFLEDEAEPEGGAAYNTDEAFDALIRHLADHHDLDLIVAVSLRNHTEANDLDLTNRHTVIHQNLHHDLCPDASQLAVHSRVPITRRMPSYRIAGPFPRRDNGPGCQDDLVPVRAQELPAARTEGHHI